MEAQASGKVLVRVSGTADEEGTTAFYESNLASFATVQSAPYLHVPSRHMSECCMSPLFGLLLNTT